VREKTIELDQYILVRWWLFCSSWKKVLSNRRISKVLVEKIQLGRAIWYIFYHRNLISDIWAGGFQKFRGRIDEFPQS